METPQEIAKELTQLYEQECRGPFPYADCRKLLATGDQTFDALIPDLDMFFYNIASPAGGAKRLLDWSRDQLLALKQRLDRSFFEKHPEYRPLREHITPENTPHLYKKMLLHEELRVTSLRLLRALLSASS